jgi:rhomboid protease GluP
MKNEYKNELTGRISFDFYRHNEFTTLALLALKDAGVRVKAVTSDGMAGLFGETIKVALRFEDGFAQLDLKCTLSHKDMTELLQKLRASIYESFEILKATSLNVELARKYETIYIMLGTLEDYFAAKEKRQYRIKNEDFKSIIVPGKKFFVTPLLIYANTLVWIVLAFFGANIFFPTAGALLRLGGNMRPYTMDGEWWRLITSVFMHAGIEHLLANTYALVMIGFFLEPRIGRKKFIFIYLCSGVIASIFSMASHQVTVSVGASGAIFGMFGAYFALLTSKMVDTKHRKVLLLSIGGYVGFNLLYGLIPGSIVDNAAHLGGLFGGLALGYIMIITMKHPGDRDYKGLAAGVGLILTFMIFFITIAKTPKDALIYKDGIEEFKALLTITEDFDQEIKDEIMDEQFIHEKIKNLYIPELEKGIVKFKQIGRLNLDEDLLEQARQCRKFLELKKKYYDLTSRKIMAYEETFDLSDTKTKIKSMKNKMYNNEDDEDIINPLRPFMPYPDYAFDNDDY